MPLKPAVSSLARQTLKIAYDELDRTITPGDKRDFGNTTLEHVRKATRDIENQLAARQSLRNMGRLMPLFKGLEHYSKVIDVLCNGTPFLSWIWSPITLILRIACEYVETFEKIIRGYSSIAESLKRFEILRDAFIREPEFQQTLAVFYADILELHKHAYKFVRRSGWKIMFLTSWGRFERKFNNILEDLKQHGSLIDQEANARNIAEARKMREENQSRLEREETERSAKQFETIASWLKVNESDQLATFDSICFEVAGYEGTCGWILQNPKVISWLQNKPDTPALWLQGSAGTGKSVLCTQLVNFMKASSLFVVYHFCTYRYASSTAYEEILKSLILQLIRKDSDLVAYVYETYVLEKKSPTTTALEQLFHSLLANMSNEPSQAEYAWIIIDGLDECEPDKQTRLIRLINQATSKPSLPGTTVCKVLISSRSPPNALQSLRRKQTISLTEEKTCLQGAIGKYVRERLRLLDTRLRQLDIGQVEAEEIRAVVVAKADGMFLYARLVMDYLASKIFYSGDEIKQSVNQLPKKLADFYHKILAQILIHLDPRSGDRVRCILGWVAFAKRPLRKLESLSALSFSPGDPKVDRLAPQYILDICGTLVEEGRDSTLAFIHISVKEFLQSSSSSIIINQHEALHEHGVATVTCLLSGLRVFGGEFPGQETLLRVGKGLHGLHVYATEYWTEYLLSHSAELADEIEGSNSGAPEEHNPEMNRINECLASLGQYPTLQKHVERALKARSLKNLEARILEGVGASNSSKSRVMSDKISTLLASYQVAVVSLLDYDHLPGLSGDELELFRAHSGAMAFTCRLGSCPRATLGFETERLRSKHERSHVRCFPCMFPGCQHPPLTSAKALKSHTNKYHIPATPRKTIRRTGTTHVQRSQQSPRAPGFNQRPTMAQMMQASGTNSLPQLQDHQFPPRKRPESDVDGQQQSKVLPQASQDTGPRDIFAALPRSFRTMNNLNLEEMGQRGEVFRLYITSDQDNDKVRGYRRLVAAAAFGHIEEVKKLIWGHNISPEQGPLPLIAAAPGFSTPILAAIGGPSLDVMKLIVSHPDFDPTMGYMYQTYAEVAEKRRGPHWEEESRVLKNAAGNYRPMDNAMEWFRDDPYYEC